MGTKCINQITMSISQSHVDQIHVTRNASNQLKIQLEIYLTTPAGHDKQFLHIYMYNVFECHRQIRLYQSTRCY